MSLPLGKVIAEYESRHTELVQAIADVEYASDALTAQYSKVAELQTQAEEVKAKYEKVLERVKKGEKQAENSEKSFKISFLRRGNTKGKEKRKEGTQIQIPAYLEALQEETRERDRQIELQQTLAEAQNERAALEEKAKECNALKIRLDALYDLIFNGPTPGFPEEDQLEQQVSAAKAVYDRMQANFNTEKQAYEHIYRAEKILRECKSKLKNALQCAATFMFASGRSVQEKETACLQDAHALGLQVVSIIQEARQLSPGIRPLENLSIIQEVPSRAESESGDAFYAKLKSASSEVARAHTQLSAERTNYAGRTTAAKSVIEGAEQTLAQYKDELWSLRKRIFENVVEKLQQQSLLRTNGMHRIQGDDDDDDDYIEAPPPSYEYEPSTFVPTFSPSALIIPNKYMRQLPTPYIDDASSPMSSGSHIWPASPTSQTPSIRRIRPLPRPPGT